MADSAQELIALARTDNSAAFTLMQNHSAELAQLFTTPDQVIALEQADGSTKHALMSQIRNASDQEVKKNVRQTFLSAAKGTMFFKDLGPCAAKDLATKIAAMTGDPLAMGEDGESPFTLALKTAKTNF